MGTIEETEKRLRLAENISTELEGIVKGVLLGGSMGFGQNFSVTEKSDIDMVIVCNKESVRKLSSTKYFQEEIHKNVLSMFEEGTINLFWVTKYIDSVEINSFIYETKGFKDFCNLKGGLVGYIPTKPSEIQESYGFDGSLFKFGRNVRAHEEGFLYEKPALAEGKFWGGPPRSDFLIKSHKMYQEDNFFDDLKEETWNSVLKQFIKENGKNFDLNNVNILNTDFSFQRKPEKIPQEVMDNVNKETKKRLEKLESEAIA